MSGVAVVVSCGDYILCATSVRHSVPDDWACYFDGAAPPQVYTLTPTPLILQSVVFSDQEVGKAIRRHAESQGWHWKTSDDVEIVEICRRMSSHITPRLEICRGALMDDETPEEAAHRKLWEEFALRGLTLIPRGTCTFEGGETYLYHAEIPFSTFITARDTLSHRYLVANWHCPHDFTTHLPPKCVDWTRLLTERRTRSLRIMDASAADSLYDVDFKLLSCTLG